MWLITTGKFCKCTSQIYWQIKSMSFFYNSILSKDIVSPSELSRFQIPSGLYIYIHIYIHTYMYIYIYIHTHSENLISNGGVTCLSIVTVNSKLNIIRIIWSFSQGYQLLDLLDINGQNMSLFQNIYFQRSKRQNYLSHTCIYTRNVPIQDFEFCYNPKRLLRYIIQQYNGIKFAYFLTILDGSLDGDINK